MVPQACLAFGWCWITVGLVSGTVIGLFFHRADWLGGYDAWPRRMVRLGHIAFLGTGILNLLFALTVLALNPEPTSGGPDPLVTAAGAAWVLGAISMPTICLLASWRKPLRHLFFIPVVSMLAGGVMTTWVALKGVAG